MEKRVVPPLVKIEAEFLNHHYVYVRQFNGDGLKAFMDDCQKVLSGTSNKLPIMVDSYGGEVYAVFGMLDFLKGLKDVEIVTYCQTKAMSAGALLFSAGHKRIMSPNATLMVHEALSWAVGKNSDVQNSAQELRRLTNRAWEIFDTNTNQPQGYWKALSKSKVNVDLYFNATQAKKHNLATDIGTVHVETVVSINRELVFTRSK